MRYATPALGGIAATALAAAVVNPSEPALYTLVGAGAVAMALIGIRAHRPARPRPEHAAPVEPWMLLILGLLMFVVGDALRLAGHGTDVTAGFPAVGDGVLVAAYGATVLGLLGLLHDRFPGQVVECLLEAGLVAGVVSLALWVLGVEREMAGGLDLVAGVTALVLTALAVFVLWLAISLVLLSPERPPCQGRLLLGVAGLSIVHAAVAGEVLGGPQPPQRLLAVGACAGYLVWAWGALHPSMSHLFEPLALGPSRLRRRQLAILSLVAFVGPLLLSSAEVAGREIDLLSLGIGLAALALMGIVYLARLVHARERVEWRAHHDELTGLPNRAVYIDRLSLALAHARRSGGGLAVMFLDLDRFKNVNDSLGHAEGNRLLQAAARRLQGCLRDDDTIARFGGDEFAVLLPEISGAHDAVGVAQKLLAVFEKPFDIADRQLFTSTSVGVALYPSDGVEADQLLRNADAAMYRAKERGRNAFHLYSKEISARMRERLALETALHGAIDRGELVLHYQPKVEVMTGRIVGVEALVRWRHPERGLIGPDEFIPIAEETGLIGDLGEWVLQVACAQTRAWQDDGLPELILGVNVSPRQFRDQRVADMVARILRSTGLEPWFLELELTEGLAMETADQTMTALHDLRAMGVQSSLDDFGTGYSSLSYLTRLPIERLKIDKSFVARIGPDPDGEDAAIVRAVIVLAHSLGLQVVAEGVETPEQLVFLQEHGCDLMQGFLYSRPVPPEALREMLVRELRAVAPPAGAEALN